MPSHGWGRTWFPGPFVDVGAGPGHGHGAPAATGAVPAGIPGRTRSLPPTPPSPHTPAFPSEAIPRLTDGTVASMVRLRDIRRKVAVSVRLDARVLDWLKSKGEGHLRRINDILTNLMEAEGGGSVKPSR